LNYKSTEDAATSILTILNDEAQQLSATPKIEKTERKSKTNRMMISLKKNGQTFRITFDWVRDEYVAYHGFLLGNGYIEQEWSLALYPEKHAIPVVSPFVWKLRCRDETIQKASYPENLTEEWLRRVRKKLAVPQNA
jgi:hypothetical protein